jgi:hypothetical protein
VAALGREAAPDEADDEAAPDEADDEAAPDEADEADGAAVR